MPDIPVTIIVELDYIYNTVRDHEWVAWSIYPEGDEWSKDRLQGGGDYTKRHIVDLIAQLREKAKALPTPDGFHCIKFKVDSRIVDKLLDGGLNIVDAGEKGLIVVGDTEPIPREKYY